MRMLVFLRVSHDPLKPRKSLGFTWCLVEWGIPHKDPDKSGIWGHNDLSFIFPFPYENGPQFALLVCFGYNSIIQSKSLLCSSNSKL